RASAILLVAFGSAYALWAWRKGGHFHPGGALLHARDDKAHCDGHEGPEATPHLHYHADDSWIDGRAGKAAGAVALMRGLQACVLVLPVMLAAADGGFSSVALVTSAYAATTIALMVGLSVAGVAGARRLPVPPAARHMETASGLVIAAVGLLVL